jgi:hypothetical protein
MASDGWPVSITRVLTASRKSIVKSMAEPWPGFPGRVFRLPVLVQRIADPCKPRPILGLLQQFRRCEVPDAIGRRIE